MSEVPEDRRARFRREIQLALSDLENGPGDDIAYPVRVGTVVHDGVRIQIFDAADRPCLPGFVDDAEAAVALVRWINALAGFREAKPEDNR